MVACEFCAIVGGEADAYILHEDDRTLAFLDRNPAVDGHTLVVPKDHRAELLEGDEAGEVFDTVQVVSDRLDGQLDPDGFSIFYTTETLIGSVRHAHVHLLPRWDDDNVSIALEREPLDDEKASTLAAAVKNQD